MPSNNARKPFLSPYGHHSFELDRPRPTPMRATQPENEPITITSASSPFLPTSGNGSSSPRHKAMRTAAKMSSTAPKHASWDQPTPHRPRPHPTRQTRPLQLPRRVLRRPQGQREMSTCPTSTRLLTVGMPKSVTFCEADSLAQAAMCFWTTLGSLPIESHSHCREVLQANQGRSIGAAREGTGAGASSYPSNQQTRTARENYRYGREQADVTTCQKRLRPENPNKRGLQ